MLFLSLDKGRPNQFGPLRKLVSIIVAQIDAFRWLGTEF